MSHPDEKSGAPKEGTLLFGWQRQAVTEVSTLASVEEKDLFVCKVKACKQIIHGSSSHPLKLPEVKPGVRGECPRPLHDQVSGTKQKR